MKRNIADLIRVGILVPALVVTMVGCGAATAKGADAKAEEETVAAEEAKPAEEAAPAAEDKVYENKGFKVTVPGELADKITVQTPDDNDDGVIFGVYETASMEASKAKTDQDRGAGWLFTITSRTEEQVKTMLASDYPGEYPIARLEDGSYLVYHHPTDVRYERETPEQMQADQEEWTKANEWAYGVRESFAKDNGLEAVTYNDTQVEAALARVAFGEDVNYTISTLEHGPLAPNGVDPLPFYEKLTKGAHYVNLDAVDETKSAGEYAVLAFPDEEIRFDFLFAEGSENIIRMVVGPEGSEEEYYTEVTFDDGTTKASEVMHEWYNALVEANGIK